MSIDLGGEGGALTVSTGAVAQIVAQAAEHVHGVRVRKARRRVEVVVESDAAHVTLALSLAYGLVIPDASREVQERVADSVRAMLGLETGAVDVSVEELEE